MIKTRMPALGRALIGPAEGLPGGRSWKRGGSPRSESEARLLRLIGQSGCPICHESADHDKTYFFWFLNENYYEPFTIDALTRSLGFCLAHGDMLVRTLAGGSALRYVHELLTWRVLRVLDERTRAQRHRQARAPLLRPTGPCPACQARHVAEDRNVIWLAGLLECPQGIDQYGRPGLLCFGHLQRVAPHVSDAVFLHLLRVHAAAMQAALDTLPTIGAPLTVLVHDQARDLRAPVLASALALSVGHDIRPDPYPSPEEYCAPLNSKNPVAECLGALCGDACAICLERRRAWLEWTAWLGAAAGRREAPADLLPTCPEHVWPLIRHGGIALATAVTWHALGAALEEVHIAVPRQPPPPRRLPERIDERLWGPQRRLAAARAALARGLRCPVCARLAVAEERALALLLAVLEDPHN